jgi:hypothetical protein
MQPFPGAHAHFRGIGFKALFFLALPALLGALEIEDGKALGAGIEHVAGATTLVGSVVLQRRERGVHVSLHRSGQNRREAPRCALGSGTGSG